MAAPSKAWVAIADSQVAADAPGDTILMTGIRDNLVHLEEWLGMGYTAAQNHDHDGANSKLVTAVAPGSITALEIAASAVAQSELKTSTGAVSIASASKTNLTLPGGEYGFYPQVKMSDATTLSWYSTIMDRSTTFAGWTTYATNISLSSAVGKTIYAQQRYVQASPPYKIGNKVWGHFLFLLRDIATGTVKAAYEAEDPPWAYNGAVWLPKDDSGRLSEVPHPFADYWDKDPAIDGLEIVMVDLSERNIKQAKADAGKTGQGLLENIPGLITGKGMAKAHADYLLPEIARFTSQVKIVTP